jgi:tRNA U34 5-methylaminomethyl-2-thiouridine-forming methyltransferase MnmC
MNKIITTADGSNTLFNETIGEHYHSTHGAVQESQHVFLNAGLKHAIELLPGQEISLLEVGFGTGLNFLLTLAFCQENNINAKYTAAEAFPLTNSEIIQTNYGAYVSPDIWNELLNNYDLAINERVTLFGQQQLTIIKQPFQEIPATAEFDLIYYDAFSVRHQPEMWTDEIIAHAAAFLKPGGTFVTYAITGKLKRCLKALGFRIEKLPGAAGKREMLRATKEDNQVDL